jgi:redox-sensitive bicupin YhaK (pirin superfamily)
LLACAESTTPKDGNTALISLRRASERQHSRRGKREVWLTFDVPDPTVEVADGFGTLEAIEEDRLPPGAIVPRHAHRDGEIITIVREGALAFTDTTGRSGVIHAGEFQTRSNRRGVRQRESNASRTEWAHVFRIWLRAAEDPLAPVAEQKRFSAADRRGALCVVASPDARRASLRIRQDALMYSALLERGQHVVYELVVGRSAWLHLVRGEATLGDLVLGTGDGAGVSAERAISLTAREDAELFLLDLNGDAPAAPQGARQAPGAPGSPVLVR